MNPMGKVEWNHSRSLVGQGWGGVVLSLGGERSLSQLAGLAQILR